MYYLRLFTLHKHDIKKTWFLINSTITNESNGKLHCEFDLDGKIITNSDEIADAFNEYLGENYPIKLSPFTSIVII